MASAAASNNWRKSLCAGIETVLLSRLKYNGHNNIIPAERLGSGEVTA
jgi:hypothetical protein